VELTVQTNLQDEKNLFGNEKSLWAAEGEAIEVPQAA
jgi:hypothetical protein